MVPIKNGGEMPKKKDYESYRINIYLPLELVKWGRQRAKQMYGSFSEYIRHLILKDKKENK